jgi:hypothetical protein
LRFSRRWPWRKPSSVMWRLVDIVLTCSRWFLARGIFFLFVIPWRWRRYVPLVRQHPLKLVPRSRIFLLFSSTLKMEATLSSETLVNTISTRLHISGMELSHLKWWSTPVSRNCRLVLIKSGSGDRQALCIPYRFLHLNVRWSDISFFGN